ncbi:catechol 1,2-dioxygenase [Streptomyces netropsis]|uniref:Aromatic ring-opening dioxygenase catalytic subunit (LigB family) n=1 Tax=Streptomyces netropsis TaxID=55404 RepID=A0A7W7LIB3_STRNE|nr:catechol 1,2-dioxygenase [Streptomyces netropsis]MBB4890730.1 aromatic ring-opening dioxygenase catalytic subunit (LigB family) [Streptomyces netropsis]GGR51319.1 dioxygenase [Streptomyces netropsis]
MGDIVGAGLLSHAPVIMFPEQVRIRENGGRDFTLATGLTRLRHEVIDTTDHDTVVVFDSHWATTTETVITAHPRRAGLFTSDEMPGAISRLPYDIPGDPELAHGVAALAERRSRWITANDDPHLPIHYATLNLWTYLGRAGTPWVSVSVCQTATTEDFLDVGRVLAEALAGLDRKVLLLASGGLSHRFWPLAELRERMAGDPGNIVTPEARAADEQRIAWLEAGRHDQVIGSMPEYLRFAPEARFGHYLMLAGAVGGQDCGARGSRFGRYENGIGTGQAHIWFSRPDTGWKNEPIGR